MPHSSLIPEPPLVFSPGLAATIGLEEAILLQQLATLFAHRPTQPHRGYRWLRVERDVLLQQMPFWGPADLYRICRSLVDKGVILVESPPLHSHPELLFAMNEQHSDAPTAAPAGPGGQPAGVVKTSDEPAAAAPRSAAQLPASWGPSEDLLQLLALNHNIPRQFALDQLEDFIFYWRERGEPSHAWENKFRQHVISCWRREQQHRAEAFRVDQNQPLDNHWQPSRDALEIMLRSGIDRDFIREATPEFILYWRERGDAPKELNSKFIQHIRIQWAKYTSSMRHSTEPRRITEDWQPDDDVFDILRLSHIDEDFARGLLPEFIVYWRDSNQAHTSWNSKFLQHVKFHWAKQHRIDQAGHSHDGQQGSSRTGRTRDRSLADDLNDTSWAD
ncbi:MAG: hypothetical protein CME43_15735 [Haliea sp.]|uniref:DnaT-like ssDNA-binding domain-containing protein n=1 Tax=Haliea sp. TaxID=1932666 RepID=UPI000C4FD93C|nr:DnaT-like ssDNA-binding domain-containing protein [Haliea sp.]MBM70916.1 hypothetical protein [Haliea sp.]|tara:strand:+ start:44310 stop:45476 length:1167 start_codon:yes stop_codon:yes gene_type:complete